ncbi:MAG: tRNA (5-methylaminomethyl-2-thiouridine)(34)-methyltransferase MnmD [Prevotellaceae bacterium]|jgi:tRNA U34 5-methylaminomethyl-2-thiouridine-forming methyltransferase MnmC|nr:tRNA (5-methylaminomethyl-2-thiouridine)(34)-methyltransferase MnmD [Prevotellaceae bacterium]
MKIVETQDGSHTVYASAFDEHYHSTNGAAQESRHIFINAGLKMCEKTEIRVFEVGFGTGLNAFLALLEAEQSGKKVFYSTIELYPLAAEDIEKLNYPQLTDCHCGQVQNCHCGLDPQSPENYFQKIHAAGWGSRVEITPHFSIEKIKADFTEFDLEENVDVIFFDAFSPEKQPEMWSEKIFAKLYEHCNEGAILTTYCAKGSVRRAMQTAGFAVERLPGPPGKREILRGIKRI